MVKISYCVSVPYAPPILSIRHNGGGVAFVLLLLLRNRILHREKVAGRHDRLTTRKRTHPHIEQLRKDYKTRIQANRNIINTLSCEAYPSLYHILHKNSHSLFSRLQFIFDKAEYTENQVLKDHGDFYFFCTLTRFAHDGSAYAHTRETWERTVILFACIGLIKRSLPEYKAKNTAYEKKALRTAKEQEHQRATAFYTIKPYTEEHLHHMEEMARKWIDGHGNFSDFSKTTIIKIFGYDVADIVYQDTRDESERKTELERRLAHILQIELFTHPYTTKETLIRRMVEADPEISYREARATWDRTHHDIMQATGARHHRPTAEEKERYSLNGNGWIITWDDTIEETNDESINI